MMTIADAASSCCSFSPLARGSGARQKKTEEKKKTVWCDKSFRRKTRGEEEGGQVFPSLFLSLSPILDPKGMNGNGKKRRGALLRVNKTRGRGGTFGPLDVRGNGTRGTQSSPLLRESQRGSLTPPPPLMWRASFYCTTTSSPIGKSNAPVYFCAVRQTFSHLTPTGPQR